jgi:hypothetical protein
MAYEIPGPAFTLESAADYRTKQFYFVGVDTNGRALLPTADGAIVAGVLQNDPNQFEAATIVDRGIVQIVSDGSIEIGKPVSAKNGGKAKESASGEYVQGVALEGDGAVDGAIITVLLRNQGRLA